jgi:exodeoxyribonuclease VII small subunit
VASPGGRAAERGAGSKADRPTAHGASPMPYEQARDELTELVRKLEAGGLSLQESLQLWERGEELAAICEGWLEGARARLAEALAGQNKPADPSGAPF